MGSVFNLKRCSAGEIRTEPTCEFNVLAEWLAHIIPSAYRIGCSDDGTSGLKTCDNAGF